MISSRGDFGKEDVFLVLENKATGNIKARDVFFACFVTVRFYNGSKRLVKRSPIRCCYREELPFFCMMGVSCHLSPSCFSFFLMHLCRKGRFSLIVLVALICITRITANLECDLKIFNYVEGSVLLNPEVEITSVASSFASDCLHPYQLPAAFLFLCPLCRSKC